MLKISINKSKHRVGVLLTVEHAKKQLKIESELTDAPSKLSVNSDVAFSSVTSILRYLGRAATSAKLYGRNSVERGEVDHWLQFATSRLTSTAEFSDAVENLNKTVESRTYLVGEGVTLADLAVWGSLRESAEFRNLLTQRKVPEHVLRYFSTLAGRKEFVTVDGMLPPSEAIQLELPVAQVSTESTKKERKEEGKFVELPGAEMGKVVVRFPPEASGFLHIGHAKAALLNQYYQQSFNGKLIMRFDDTNPEKENADFEKVILEDIKMLGLKPDVFTFTSDHFENMSELCTKMIREGKAYVDDTEPEQMKKEREERVENANRSNSVEKNLTMWEEMKKGSPTGQKCCVRAKLNMQSDNGCLRDPTMYRCKPETHARTGNKYKAYPTYDFACPIVDSVEGVTHALRTMEYHDRDEQYVWFLKALNLREPHLWEYSRLNLQNTVMSKRKLTWFVESGLVEGWDDPRFPTVRGVMRRGMTVEGLKEFVIAQGSSRSINMMDWDKIWAFNKKVIDPIVPRYTALLKDDLVPVLVNDAAEEMKEVQKHPKDPEVGNKKIWYGKRVLVEGADAAEFVIGESVTFINWGNLTIKKVNKAADGKVASVEASLNLDNKDYKKTQKITWLTETDKAPLVPAVCVHFDHIISKAVLGKDEDFKQFINHNSKTELYMAGDPELVNLKKGDIIQLQRRGFYICDSAYEPASRYSGRESPCILFNIPDGHSKEMPTTGSKHKAKDAGSAKEKAQSQKGKLAEKSPQTEISPSIIGGGGAKSEAETLNLSITEQGSKVRQLKSEKADKAEIDKAVKLLLQLKEDFKKATGQVWKPDMVIASSAATVATAAAPAAAGSGDELNCKIVAQGDRVRDLKAANAAKDAIDKEVKQLLQLKEEYKKATGQAWKPGMVSSAPAAAVAAVAAAPAAAASPAAELHAKIVAQGNVVRDLKAAKATKDAIDKAVKTLLQLKEEYKAATGEVWKPEAAAAAATVTAAPSAAAATTSSSSGPVDELYRKVEEQGNKVRDLKSKKAAKAEIDAAVKALLGLKVEYKTLTGADYAPGGAGAKPQQGDAGAKTQQSSAGAKGGNKKEGAESKKADKGKQNEKTAVAAADAGGREVKKVTRLGMEVRKEENFAEWYSQVITKAEMIEYYDVSGCYVLRPWAFNIWETISKWFDAEIKKIGFENCYFPMFVSHSALETEKEHVEDFAPEVAWVTKSGDSELAEPIAIRPTSETVMYPSYAKWVQSHRDLPIKLNQWCNVVRWEFKHPQPFLRTREFLWQEGHSAYATYAEAEKEVYHIIDLYEYIYEQMLAIPVIKGKKTQKEKFAGGDYTTTVEAYIGSTGRGIQAATSHHLGQNFSKMFDISFEDPETKERRYAYQNSWAITTRSIGIIVMVHGDDKGLVLPPRIAHVQVIVVPCGVTAQMSDKEKTQLMDKCEEFVKSLESAGVRARGDYRDNYSPGWKFNHWELKGVPIRVEIGPRDVQKGEFVAVRRDTGDKQTLKLGSGVASLQKLLEDVQSSMFTKTKKDLDGNVAQCKDFSEFCTSLDKSKLILAPFCGAIKCEEEIKKLSARDAVTEEGAPAMGAKGLCIPFKQPTAVTPTDKCICPGCSAKPQYYTLFGRSY